MKTIYAIYFAIVFLGVGGCGDDNSTSADASSLTVATLPDAGSPDVYPGCIFEQDTSYTTGITTVQVVCDGVVTSTRCYTNGGAPVSCPTP